MARRATPPAPPLRPNHSVEEKRQDITRLQRRIEELERFDPSQIQKRWAPETTQLQTSIDEALSAVFGHGSIEYNRYSSATSLDHGPITMSFGDHPRHDAHEAREYVAEGKASAIGLLKLAIKSLEEEIEFAPPTVTASAAKPVLHPSKVFVVHGHDIAARESMARFLEKIELDAIILHEQPDRGMTVIEKFEAFASQVGFAVVLLTPDDVGGAVSSSAEHQRARQNVIFELGYFAGKLGRGKACLVRKGDVEIPSDLAGVVYTEMDAADAWKIKLVRELKAAGMKFDANKVWE